VKTLPGRRLPKSGNAALLAGALVQAVLGIEFLLTGLSKLADPRYTDNFKAFIAASPGSHRGAIAPLIQTLVLPHMEIAAQLAKFGEIAIGLTLMLAAAETARRRLPGRLGGRLPYERGLALAGAGAGLGLAGISITIFLIQGGVLPTVNPGRAFAAAIPVELMMVAFGVAMAGLQFARYLALAKPGSGPRAVRRLAA
jgi:hypothetical protein